MLSLGALAWLFFFSSNASATTYVPQSFTVGGTLYDSPTGTSPLLDANVTLEFEILDSAKSCVLYAETQTADTSTSDGLFSVQVGAGSRVGGVDSGNTLATIFQNVAAITATGCAGNSYTPSSGAVRYLRIIVTPSAGSPDTLAPDMAIDSVPNAVVAENAELLQGLPASSFLQAGGGSMTGAIVGEDGSHTAPAFSFAGDTNTGIFDSSTGVLGITAGGSTAMTVSGSAVSIAANENLTMASGTGQFSQTYTGTSNAASITANSLSAGSSALTIASSATASGIVYGVNSSLTGAATTNVAGYFSATGATNNYGILVPNGSVGIGTTSPISSLDLSQKTDALALPAGGSTQEPSSPTGGMIRFNSTTSAVETYSGNNGWGEVATTTGSVHLTNQSANISATTLATPSVDTIFQITCISVVTTAAGTSSTLPAVRFYWTDADSGYTYSAIAICSTNSGNVVGTAGSSFYPISAKGGTNVQYDTSGYASNPANAMKYAIKIRLLQMP